MCTLYARLHDLCTMHCIQWPITRLQCMHSCVCGWYALLRKHNVWSSGVNSLTYCSIFLAMSATSILTFLWYQFVFCCMQEKLEVSNVQGIICGHRRTKILPVRTWEIMIHGSVPSKWSRCQRTTPCFIFLWLEEDFHWTQTWKSLDTFGALLWFAFSSGSKVVIG